MLEPLLEPANHIWGGIRCSAIENRLSGPLNRAKAEYKLKDSRGPALFIFLSPGTVDSNPTLFQKRREFTFLSCNQAFHTLPTLGLNKCCLCHEQVTDHLPSFSPKAMYSNPVAVLNPGCIWKIMETFASGQENTIPSAPPSISCIKSPVLAPGISISKTSKWLWSTSGLENYWLKANSAEDQPSSKAQPWGLGPTAWGVGQFAELSDSKLHHMPIHHSALNSFSGHLFPKLYTPYSNSFFFLPTVSFSLQENLSFWSIPMIQQRKAVQRKKNGHEDKSVHF